MSLTGISNSRLGFGCVQLTAQNRRDALNGLEHSFTNGITHFDVARAYGFGRAEGILRDFLKTKRSHVTVTTKFGIEPPSGLAGNARIINGLKRTLRYFPGVLRRVKSVGSAMTKSGIFTPESAIRSLETSLRELGTDYVDIFLLHEATSEDASSGELLEALLKEIEKGKIKKLGLGSAFSKIMGCGNSLPAIYSVLQFEDNAFDRNVRKFPTHDSRSLITHSVFNRLQILHESARAFPEITRQYSARLNADLSESKPVSSLMLRFALWNNPNGMVLFSSKNPRHIEINIHNSSLAAGEEEMRLFAEFVDRILVAKRTNVPHTFFGESA
jgi:D-threo-aldose 1-dehydrogenase